MWQLPQGIEVKTSLPAAASPFAYSGGTVPSSVAGGFGFGVVVVEDVSPGCVVDVSSAFFSSSSFPKTTTVPIISVNSTAQSTT